MRIITYTQARLRGRIRYFTGKLCRRGHRAERYTSGRYCLECNKVQKEV